MQKIYYLFVALILFITTPLSATSAGAGKASLSGKITDKITGEGIPGVTIYIPDLKTGGVTDINGAYKLDNLPQTKILVQISYIGYKTIVETIDLSTTTTKDFAMET